MGGLSSRSRTRRPSRAHMAAARQHSLRTRPNGMKGATRTLATSSWVSKLRKTHSLNSKTPAQDLARLTSEPTRPYWSTTTKAAVGAHTQPRSRPPTTPRLISRKTEINYDLILIYLEFSYGYRSNYIKTTSII